MTPTVMLSDFRVMSLSETDRNDTAINNERKSTFSFLYISGTAEYALTLQQTERNNSEKQKPMPKYVGNN